MIVLSTFAILAILPALSVLYREFIHGRTRRSAVLVTVGICAGSAVIWLVVAACVPQVVSSPLWLPAAALAAVAGFLCSLPIRDLTPRTGPAVVYAFVWVLAIYVPAALIVLFPREVGIAAAGSAIDLGGALPVHVTVGASALVVAVFTRKRPNVARTRSRPAARALLLWGVVLWVGWTVGLAGLELAIDDVTPRILLNCLLAPLASLGGWLLIQRMRLHSTSVDGAVTGLVCGLVAVTPACGYLDPLWAIVTGAVAGVSCAAFLLGRLRSPARRSWYLVGVHLVAAAIGLVLLGFFASGYGFIYTGQPGPAQSQVTGTLAVAVWAALLSLALWPIARRLIVRTSLRPAASQRRGAA